MTTPRLSLSELAASQSQPHLTINSALRRLDGVTQLSVVDRALSTPPGSPAEGDTYIVGAAATGAWSAYDEDDLALYTTGAWVRIVPLAGWLAYVQDEAKYYSYDAGWALLPTGGGGGGVEAYNRVIYYLWGWLATPPGAPDPDDTYLVDATPTGDWSTYEEGSVAWWDGAAWNEITPKIGDIFFADWDSTFYYWDNVAGPYTFVELIPAAPGGGFTYSSQRSVFKVIDMRGTPPGGPVDGDAYLLNTSGSSLTGAWSGWTRGNIASYNGAAWEQVAVAVGDLVYRLDLERFHIVRTISGSPRTYLVLDSVKVAMSKTETPTASETIGAYGVVDYLTFPADFAGSAGYPYVLPTATFTVTIKNNGSDVGTFEITAGGATTFTTDSGLPWNAQPGDCISFHAQTTPDTTLEGLGITLVGFSYKPN